MTASLCLSEVIELLKNEGFDNATKPRIHHAIGTGYIPRPVMDKSLRYRFSQKNVRELRAYLADVPSRGRKPATV